MTEDGRIAAAVAAAVQGCYADAVAALRPLAEAGSVRAAYELGRLALTECELVTGREAFSWLQRAALADHADALYHLATFPAFASEGFTSPLTDRERWTLLLRGAERGSVDAQYHAAGCLASGDVPDGESQSLEAAVEWYRRAASTGHADAEYNLAWMLLTAEGCTRDTAEGVRWLTAARDHGHVDAGRLLTHVDVSGVDDVFPPR